MCLALRGEFVVRPQDTEEARGSGGAEGEGEEGGHRREGSRGSGQVRVDYSSDPSGGEGGAVTGGGGKAAGSSNSMRGRNRGQDGFVSGGSGGGAGDVTFHLSL